MGEISFVQSSSEMRRPTGAAIQRYSTTGASTFRTKKRPRRDRQFDWLFKAKSRKAHQYLTFKRGKPYVPVQV